MGAPRGHVGRIASTAVAGLLVLVVGGCGPSPSGSTPTARPTTSRPVSSATPITTTDPGDPTLLPVPMDVPFTQAPPPVQNEWRQYYATGAITVVPNSTVPFARPSTPQVVNVTNGAIDTATSQRWGDALMRENAWENWAITANQISLFDNGVVSSPQAEPGLVLPQGATGFRIVGPRWPTSLRLVPVSSSTKTFLHDNDSYAYLLTFSQAWSVDAVFPSGATQPVADQQVAAGARFVVVGQLKQLNDFGELWYGSASFACDSSEPGPVLTLCAE
jgi:hypothetical protein